MIKSCRLFLAVLATASMTCLPAKATLVQATDPSFGVNSLTTDTATGLTWLDLTASTGLSYQQVLAATLPGGIYSGFRYATAQEVVSLYTDAGIPGAGFYPASNPAIASFLSLVGATSLDSGHPETFGLSATSDGPGSQFVPGIDFFYNSGIPTYQVTGIPGQAGDLGYGVTTSDRGVGSWLVSVPETADAGIYVLAAGGLIGFAFLQRRGKAA
ncbi:MAG: hypothetical protein P4N60_18165 [Verrucomicrobiae bacterium]|nr:hypothetical protein [Verrucomicrobiae bacterium]